jgi:hypothetical protein
VALVLALGAVTAMACKDSTSPGGVGVFTLISANGSLPKVTLDSVINGVATKRAYNSGTLELTNIGSFVAKYNITTTKAGVASTATETYSGTYHGPINSTYTFSILLGGSASGSLVDGVFTVSWVDTVAYLPVALVFKK